MQNRNQVEEFRISVAKTEKYIQCYQPISIVTEIDKMIRAVLPRRRHLTLLKAYTTQRQERLTEMINELEKVPLDKEGYTCTELYFLDRA